MGLYVEESYRVKTLTNFFFEIMHIRLLSLVRTAFSYICGVVLDVRKGQGCIARVS